MELTGLVFSRSFPDRRTLFFVVRKGTTKNRKVLVSPIPAVVERFCQESWICWPDWESVEHAMKEGTTKIRVSVCDDDGIPFLQYKEHILRLCLKGEDGDIYTPPE
nr:hypothetical protein MarFTME_262 [Marseillevirus futianmevirus]